MGSAPVGREWSLEVSESTLSLRCRCRQARAESGREAPRAGVVMLTHICQIGLAPGVI